MIDETRAQLEDTVNVPDGEMVQFASALGAAILGYRRVGKLREEAAVS